jgi:GNAT superfamily N-acetyltransferase
MSHNPRYYGRLLESCGMSKVKDMYAYLVTRATVAGDRFQRVMKAVRRRAPKLDIQSVRMDRKGFREDLDTMLQVFNQAWVQNWGFLPVTPAEADAIATDLKPIVRPEITAIARMEGKAVGMTVCVPNINEVLRKMPDGRLFPTGGYTLLNGLRTIRGFRTIMMGVVPDHRGKGIDAMMIDHVIRNGSEKGYQYCELSWVLEVYSGTSN